MESKITTAEEIRAILWKYSDSSGEANPVSWIGESQFETIISEIAAQLKQAEQCAGVWVKTSERLPDKFGIYICHVEVKDDEGLAYRPVSYVQFDTLKKDWTRPSVCGTNGIVLDWLDESQQSQPQQSSLNDEEIGIVKEVPELLRLTGESIQKVKRLFKAALNTQKHSKPIRNER